MVLVEAGIGWIPHFRERLDTRADNHGWEWRRPSSRISSASATAMATASRIWATKYPQPDSSWPRSHEVLQEHFAGLPAEEIEMMASGYVTRLDNL